LHLCPADNTSAQAPQAPAPHSAPMPVSAPPPVLAPHSTAAHAALGPSQLKPPGMASLAVVASLPSIAVPAADTSEEVDVGRAIVTQKTVDINNMEDGYKWRKWVALLVVLLLLLWRSGMVVMVWTREVHIVDWPCCWGANAVQR
jgi:hypothetical protein